MPTSTSPYQYITTNESITVVYEGKPHVVKKGSAHYLELRKAIEEERWGDVPSHLTVGKSVETWSNDKFKISGNQVTYLGQEVPNDINERILAMATNGEDPTILFNFWERLSKNPSYRSVNQLYSFMKHVNIPLTPEGKILTYKSVRNDYKDVHSGKFDNHPGVTNEMPRNKISDDPKVACHEGFHVGAMGYVNSFHAGGRIIVCEVDPEDVVCVPYDEHSQKMRVCKYKVIGHHGVDLPSTSVSLEDIGRGVEPEYGEDDLDENEMEAAPPPDDVEVESDVEPDDDENEIPEEESEEEELEKDKPVVRAAPTKPAKKKPNKGFAKFNKMDMPALTKQSLDDLRKYATYGLEIIGASKIPGGKTALIARILEIREDD